MFKAHVNITLRPSILDVQGKAVEHSVHTLGYTGVKSLRIGKYIEILIDADSEEKAKKQADEMCQKLLANMVMEDFKITVEKI